MNLSEVGLLTENPSKEYSGGLAGADTREKLVAYLWGWEGLVDDALAVARSMSERDFEEWRECLGLEREGKFSGIVSAEKFGPILFPELMIRAGIAEIEFGVPWGTAVLRLCEVLNRRVVKPCAVN